MSWYNLKAVIFDFDGVITATVRYHYLSWKDTVGEYGIPFTWKDNEKLLGLTRNHSLEIILGERQLPEAVKEDILRRKNERFQEWIKQMDRSDLHAGVERLLEEIQAAGLHAAVASASRNAREILSRLEIEEYFHTIRDGNTVQRSKPAPDIFLQTAASLRMSPPECVVIEDSQAGVEAALSAGMCVVGVGPAGRLSQAHCIFPDLSNVHIEDLVEAHRRWIENRNSMDSKEEKVK